jgi:hypothetical protein
MLLTNIFEDQTADLYFGELNGKKRLFAALGLPEIAHLYRGGISCQ